MYAESSKASEWGCVLDECRAEWFRDYPDAGSLAFVCEMNPQALRRLLAERMDRPRGQHDMDGIGKLRDWLNCPDGTMR